MPRNTTRAAVEAMFKRRDQQRADVPVAMAEHRAAQEAALERMRELRRQRLARERKPKRALERMRELRRQGLARERNT